MGPHIARDIEALGRRLRAPEQARVADFLDATPDHRPDDILALLDNATDGFSVGYEQVLDDAEVGPHTDIARLCFVATARADSPSSPIPEALCPISYQLIRRDSGLLEKMRADRDFFDGVTEGLSEIPTPRRGWYLTTPSDRAEVDAFFSTCTPEQWAAVEVAALQALPYTQSGCKAATLAALVASADSENITQQSISLMHRTGSEQRVTQFDQLLGAMEHVPVQERGRVVEDIASFHEEIVRSSDVRGRHYVGCDPVVALDVFGNVATASARDALATSIVALLFGPEGTPASSAVGLEELLQEIAEGPAESRAAVAAATAALYRYEDARSRTRWGAPARPYALRTLKGRIAAFNTGASQGRLADMQHMLNDLHRVGCDIVRYPYEVTGTPDPLTDFLFVLGSTPVERYAAWRDAGRLLAGDDPETNLTRLIGLGRCRDVPPLPLAENFDRLTRAFAQRSGGAGPSLALEAATLRRLCKAHRTGEQSARVTRAAARIHAGGDDDSVLADLAVETR